MIRTFLAVELPEELRQALGHIQSEAKNRLSKDLPRHTRIQWVVPQSIHLTLKFLGDIPEEQVAPIQGVVGEAVGRLAAFSVDVAGLGAFPHSRDPRVLWVGLTEGGSEPNQAPALVQLASSIDQALATLGYPREARPFTPHLTLARIKEGPREVGQALARSGVLSGRTMVGRLEVRRVALMKSELKPSGAVYTRLWEVSLAVSG